jgi:hypothetical protein
MDRADRYRVFTMPQSKFDQQRGKDSMYLVRDLVAVHPDVMGLELNAAQTMCKLLNESEKL